MGRETVTVKFAKLFKVEVWLHHLLDKDATLFDNLPDATKILQLGKYDLGKWMEITPTATTTTILKGLDWVFKPTATGFVVAANLAADNPTRPANPPNPNHVLEFEMVANNAGFGQFSAFPLPGKKEGERACYVFDNAATSSDNATAFPNLALRPPVFSQASTFDPGTIVRNGANRFVAKQKTTGVPTSNTANWAAIQEAVPYANTAQLATSESLKIRQGAFGLIRIHCAAGLGNFGLFNGQDFQNPNFIIRLRNNPVT